MKAVIFDMDGVLIDTEVEYIKRFTQIFDRLHIPYAKERALALVGSSKQNSERYLKEWLEGQMSLEAFWKIWQTCLKEAPIDPYKIRVPYIKEVLAYLKEKGYAIGLASSTEKHRILNTMEKAELLPYFDFILSGHECKHHKPHPEIYETLLKQMQIQAKDGVVIEDSTYGIDAGKAAGCIVIARKVEAYQLDLSSADYIISDMREIIEIIERI